MLLLSVFYIICPLLISLYNITVLRNTCRFELTLLLKYANPCRNWIFQCFARAAQMKGRNGTSEKTTLARTQTQVPGFYSADALATELRVPVAEP